MARFESDLIFKDDDGFPYELVEDLIYQSDLLGVIVVRKGFLTDLASIPLGLWNILPKSGKYDRAAVVHDWLYHYGSITPAGTPITRGQADSVLNEAMTVLVVGWRQPLVYRGVRLGGWHAWGNYRKSDATH